MKKWWLKIQILNVQPKRTTVNSKIISNKPRLAKNSNVSNLFFCCSNKYADVPAKIQGRGANMGNPARHE